MDLLAASKPLDFLREANTYRLSRGGNGSEPGGTVSESRQCPSRPWIVTSPPPRFPTISRALSIASPCVSNIPLARSELGPTTAQSSPRRTTYRLVMTASLYLPSGTHKPRILSRRSSDSSCWSFSFACLWRYSASACFRRRSLWSCCSLHFNALRFGLAMAHSPVLPLVPIASCIVHTVGVVGVALG